MSSYPGIPLISPPVFVGLYTIIIPINYSYKPLMFETPMNLIIILISHQSLRLSLEIFMVSYTSILFPISFGEVSPFHRFFSHPLFPHRDPFSSPRIARCEREPLGSRATPRCRWDGDGKPEEISGLSHVSLITTFYSGLMG
jgi:hypothetical protein